MKPRLLTLGIFALFSLLFWSSCAKEQKSKFASIVLVQRLDREHLIEEVNHHFLRDGSLQFAKAYVESAHFQQFFRELRPGDEVWTWRQKEGFTSSGLAIQRRGETVFAVPIIES